MACQKQEKEIEAELTSLKIEIEKLDGQVTSFQRDELRLSRTHEAIAAEMERDGAEIARLRLELEESMSALSEAEKTERELKTTADGAKSSLAQQQQEMKRHQDEETEIRLAAQTAQDTKRHLCFRPRRSSRGRSPGPERIRKTSNGRSGRRRGRSRIIPSGYPRPKPPYLPP